MNVKDVLEKVQEIKMMAHDDEAAHSREDDLHQDVLRAIAEGRCDDQSACAEAALKTLDIDFSRWCA